MTDFNNNERYTLAKRAIAHSFSAAANSYDAHAALQLEVGQRLLERLDYVKQTPTRILDVGSGTGVITRALQTRYKKAQVVGLDLAHGMTQHANQKRGWFAKERYVCGDMEKLPFATHAFDMIVSNLALQWLDDLSAVFAEFQRVLKPDGVILFATFGPDTLMELRKAWASVDDLIHVNRFMDMHDVGDAMVRSRLADPVMDCEKIVLTYRDVKTLMRELKAIGAHNINADRPHHLTAPGKLKNMMAAYEQFRRSDGFLPATYEVVYGNAWGSELYAKPTANAQEFAMPLSQIPIRRKSE